MASFTINNTLHQKHLYSVTICRAHVSNKLNYETSTKTMISKTSKEAVKGSGDLPFKSEDRTVDRKSKKQTNVTFVVKEEIDKRSAKDRYPRKKSDSRNRREIMPEFSSTRFKGENLEKKYMKTKGSSVVKEKMGKYSGNGDFDMMEKGSKKSKVGSPEAQLRIALDMCSKRGDAMGAIALYDKATREGIKLGQYHYAVLLYLCSSAAVGVVQAAKSGSAGRSVGLNSLNSSNEVSVDLEVGKGNFSSSRLDTRFPNKELLIKDGLGKSKKLELNSNGFPMKIAKDDLASKFDEKENSSQFSNGFMKPRARFLDGLVHLSKEVDDDNDDNSSNMKYGSDDQEKNKIRVSGNVKMYALRKGFEIYEMMCLEKVPMNEATLTSVARMAMSMGNGDMAFDMVKQMKALGINPKLRSYGPALSAFCNSGNIEKAFAVEEHMLTHGVYPEEPELEALLRVSVEAGKSDKVYYLLHKLRTSVRKVSSSTAELIEKWFESVAASRVGKRKWDKKLISEALENGGGGWHGQGWLGRGKWSVSPTTVGDDGSCRCCGEKLATIDLDPIETENFAESVASIATKREKDSSFQKFQKWLDYYGPFEAVVDAANVGLFSQKRFIPSKINAVVNGLRQKLPSKKWPLIILHNKRITGGKMGEPINRPLIDKWKNADALYATPTGSNDDWYWLYAAIKFKCLLVTNDEMRDHLFQLLGNDFFPKWKERHQVHFSFSDAGPVFHMPPPCSVVIQESEKGHWHIPVASEHDSEGDRTWLCITRAHSLVTRQDAATRPEACKRAISDTRTGVEIKESQSNIDNLDNTKKTPQEDYRNLKGILSANVFSSHCTVLQEIEAAEKLGSCIIDFQI